MWNLIISIRKIIFPTKYGMTFTYRYSQQSLSLAIHTYIHEFGNGKFHHEMDSALVNAEFYLSLRHIYHKSIFTRTPIVFSSALTLSWLNAGSFHPELLFTFKTESDLGNKLSFRSIFSATCPGPLIRMWNVLLSVFIVFHSVTINFTVGAANEDLRSAPHPSSGKEMALSLSQPGQQPN